MKYFFIITIDSVLLHLQINFFLYQFACSIFLNYETKIANFCGLCHTHFLFFYVNLFEAAVDFMFSQAVSSFKETHIQ